ncbi:MAG: transcriptional repressor LexA [candidate division KSB1 bacterium]|nr:transcriptional repressor LexA [candidate division KSB1 bacterium]
MDDLTEKQRRVLALIAERMAIDGYPPTLREIAQHLGVSSKNTVIKYLRRLEKKGYISKSEKARSIRLLEKAARFQPSPEVQLPLIGSVTAGQPVLAEENIERHVAIPRSLVRDSGRYFLLRVTGDSMEGAGILDGDLVVVRSTSEARNGDIVVALLGNEVTVKRLVVKGNQRYLKPENPRYEEIHPESEWTIQGVVVSLIRERVA